MTEVIKTEFNDHLNKDIKEQLIECDKYYGICCCCLESTCWKNIWSEYNWMGCPEVYSDMLQECFGLDTTQEQNTSVYICEICITTLRNCLHFRRQVFKCYTDMFKQIPMIGDVTTRSSDGNDLKEERCSDHTSINYIGDEGSDGKTTPVDTTTGERRKSCEDDNFKLVNRRTKHTNRRINSMKTRQNICLILEHSTLVPFRSNRGYFNCFYCNKQHAVFEELKSHIAEKHKGIDFRQTMECILRPEVVKTDCSDIVCRVCSLRLTNLNDLIKHLIRSHGIVFHYEGQLKPNDCIVPYNLSEGRYRCSVCDKEYQFFKTLSRHMNEHSSNYVCDKCGKCFLLPERLRAHRLMHADNNAVECDQCGKICPSNVILRNHIRYTHKKVVYVCSVCNESYRTFKERLKHMVTVHGRKLNLNCVLCPKSFESPGGLNDHVNSEHLKVAVKKRFPCENCTMMFKSRYALKIHAVTHSGERNFECEFCHKRYGRSRTLEEHLKIHRNDRRWLCRECGQTFVQKCSLRNHIKVHHNGQDMDLLIIYKEPIVKE